MRSDEVCGQAESRSYYKLAQMIAQTPLPPIVMSMIRALWRRRRD
jgi:hypothetical protein